MSLFARRGGVCFLLKPAGYLRDRQGIFKMERVLGRILAGYLNYWGPNLPLSEHNVRWTIPQYVVVGNIAIQ
jgi:hypothetical protein